MTFFQTIAQTSTLQIINKNKKHLYLKWIRRFLWCFKEKCKHSFNWHNFILPLISELLFFLRAHGILCPHNNTHIHTHTHTLKKQRLDHDIFLCGQGNEVTLIKNKTYAKKILSDHPKTLCKRSKRSGTRSWWQLKRHIPDKQPQYL